jgi:DNA-binding NarL/FixJ family response regulator
MAQPGAGRPDRRVPPPPAPPARVVLVDDNTILRRVVAIACDVTPGLELVAEIDNGEEGVALCERLEPDLVVLDVALPGIDGLEVARRIRALRAAPRILILTGRNDGPTVLGAMRAGAHGYLLKTTGMDQVASAMLRVARGERVFSPELERLAVAELGRLARSARTPPPDVAGLTPRELTILQLLAGGLTLRQTGSRLGISPRTVESHVAKVYRKLDVTTRVQAMAKAAALGLIEIDTGR